MPRFFCLGALAQNISLFCELVTKYQFRDNVLLQEGWVVLLLWYGLFDWSPIGPIQLSSCGSEFSFLVAHMRKECSLSMQSWRWIWFDHHLSCLEVFILVENQEGSASTLHKFITGSTPSSRDLTSSSEWKDGSSRVGWYPPHRNIYGWKDPNRGKLPGVYLPIGSDKGSHRLVLVLWVGGIPSVELQVGALRGRSLRSKLGDSEWEKSHNGGFQLPQDSRENARGHVCFNTFEWGEKRRTDSEWGKSHQWRLLGRLRVEKISSLTVAYARGGSRVECGLEEDPRLSPWTRDESAGMSNLLFAWDTPDAVEHVSRSWWELKFNQYKCPWSFDCRSRERGVRRVKLAGTFKYLWVLLKVYANEDLVH